MPGGNGIELIQELGDPLPYVIFVTAHPEFALPAFELQAVDYLVKPVERETLCGQRAPRQAAYLRATRGGARNATRGCRGHERRQARIPGMAHRPRLRAILDQMTIRVRRRMFSLEVSDISWIQGASQYSRVHTRKGEYLMSRSLASLESELDPTTFFRIHRSAIVNAAYVREVRSSGDGRYNVYLHSGQALPMGRARREILESLLGGINSREQLTWRTWKPPQPAGSTSGLTWSRLTGC